MFDHDHSLLPAHSHSEPLSASSLDPRGPILLALATILALVSTPPAALDVHGRMLAAIAASSLALGVPLQELRRILIILSPWLILLILLGLFSSSPESLGSGRVSNQQTLLSSALKALGSCIGLVTLRHFLGTTGLLNGLARLGLPKLLIEATGVSLRMSELISDELRRMNLARRARGDTRRWLWQASELGAGVAGLFLRSLQRAERLDAAMRARAYDPRRGLASPTNRRWRGQDSWLMATGLIAILLLRFGLPA